MNHWIYVGNDIFSVLKWIGPFVGSIMVSQNGMWSFFLGIVVYLISVLAIAGIL